MIIIVSYVIIKLLNVLLFIDTNLIINYSYWYNHNSAPCCLRYTSDISDYKRSISCVSCVIFIKDECFDGEEGGWIMITRYNIYNGMGFSLYM